MLLALTPLSQTSSAPGPFSLSLSHSLRLQASSSLPPILGHPTPYPLGSSLLSISFPCIYYCTPTCHFTSTPSLSPHYPIFQPTRVAPRSTGFPAPRFWPIVTATLPQPLERAVSGNIQLSPYGSVLDQRTRRLWLSWLHSDTSTELLPFWLV